MPIYDFKDTRDDTVFSTLMSISEKEDFLMLNPCIKQIITGAPKLIGGTGEVYSKTDDGFKELLSRHADATPFSPLADEHGSKDPKSVKIRNTLKKHRNVQT